MTTPPFISVSQAAAERGVPKRTIQHAITKGDLKAHKLPGLTGAYLIDPDNLDRWIAGRIKASA